ncbi:MAG: hypothetical protein AAF721_32510 [Myxococcota bacterium]
MALTVALTIAVPTSALATPPVASESQPDDPPGSDGEPSEAERDIVAEDGAAPPKEPDFDAPPPAKEPKDPFADGGGDEAPPGPAEHPRARELRIAGWSLVGAGGLLFVVGTVTGVAFAVNGRKFADELQQENATLATLDCDGQQPPEPECPQAQENADSARANGSRANLATALSLGLGVGLGILVAGGGVAMLVTGRRRSRRDAATNLRVRPTWSRTAAGAVLSARF